MLSIIWANLICFSFFEKPTEVKIFLSEICKVILNILSHISLSSKSVSSGQYNKVGSTRDIWLCCFKQSFGFDVCNKCSGMLFWLHLMLPHWIVFYWLYNSGIGTGYYDCTGLWIVSCWRLVETSLFSDWTIASQHSFGAFFSFPLTFSMLLLIIPLKIKLQGISSPPSSNCWIASCSVYNWNYI